MQFACVVYAGIFKHRKNIPKYEKLMVALCVCTRHILAYTTIYRHMKSYDVICRYMVGYQGIRIQDVRVWILDMSRLGYRDMDIGTYVPIPRAVYPDMIGPNIGTCFHRDGTRSYRVIPNIPISPAGMTRYREIPNIGSQNEARSCYPSRF